MGTVAPRLPVLFYPLPTKRERLEAELCGLDIWLAEALGEPERLQAPWFEGRVDSKGRYRPSLDHVIER